MADPIPNAGTQTDPTEFRRLLSRQFTPGVISGMVLTAGTGLTLTVSGGNVAVGDSNSITFLPFSATTSLTGLAPNATTTVYATYRTTGDLQAYLTTSLPSGTPYEVVGTAVTNATGVVSVDNGNYAATTSGKRHRSEPPTLVGQYHSTQAQINATRGITVPGVLQAAPGDAAVAPLGVRFGGAAQPTKRYYVRASLTTAVPVESNVWTSIPYNFDQVIRSDYDYPKPIHNASGTTAERRRLYAGPPGTYQVSGFAQFEDPDTPRAGWRSSRLVIYSATGELIWIQPCDSHQAVDGTNRVWFNATLDMAQGQWVELQTYQSNAEWVDLLPNSYSGSIPNWVSLTLLQAA